MNPFQLLEPGFFFFDWFTFARRRTIPSDSWIGEGPSKLPSTNPKNFNLLAIHHSVSLPEEEFLCLWISHGGFHSTAWSTARNCWFMGHCVGAYEVGTGQELWSAALGGSIELHSQFRWRFLAVGRARPAPGLSYLLG